MHLNRDIYWNEKTQRVRWTSNSSLDMDFKYIGPSTQTELELLVEKLFEIYEDGHITFETFLKLYNDFRIFCDNITVLLDDQNL